MVEGKLQREGEVIHVIVQRCFNFSKLLMRSISSQNTELPLGPMSRADEKSSPEPPKKVKIPASDLNQGKIFPGGRNFR